MTPIDGGAMAFVSGRGGGQRLFVIVAHVSAATPVFAVGRVQGDPAWRPDGRILAFDIGCGSSRAAVYVSDPYGAKRVDRVSPKGLDACRPSWSPGGERVAFDAATGGGDIYVVDADGRHAARLTDGPSVDLDPAWSPDGRWIAFASDRGGSMDVYAMHPDGSGLHRLVGSGGMDAAPAWSPDGTRLAFVSSREDPAGRECDVLTSLEPCNLEIYLVNADGSGLQRVTEDPSRDMEPVWSPDGSQLAFVSGRDGDLDLFVAAADGSDIIQVTDSDGSDEAPTWASRAGGEV